MIENLVALSDHWSQRANGMDFLELENGDLNCSLRAGWMVFCCLDFCYRDRFAKYLRFLEVKYFCCWAARPMEVDAENQFPNYLMDAEARGTEVNDSCFAPSLKSLAQSLYYSYQSILQGYLHRSVIYQSLHFSSFPGYKTQ